MALRSTNIFYDNSARQQQSLPYILFKGYIISVVIFAFFSALGLRVVSMPIGNAQQIFPSRYEAKLQKVQREKEKEYKSQKILVMTGFYGVKLWGKKLYLKILKPKQGDYVLASKQKIEDWGDFFIYARNYVLRVVTFSIVSLGFQEQIFKVDAVGPKKTEFSILQGIETNDDTGSTSVVSNEDLPWEYIPFVSVSQEIELKKDEVFLSAEKIQQVDSRISGSYRTRELLGKVKVLIGPVWMILQ